MQNCYLLLEQYYKKSELVFSKIMHLKYIQL